MKFHPLRKLLFILLLSAGFPCAVFSQYWQQQVNFLIDVSLNDKEHTLDGFEKIEYTNNSPDTLHFLWFHLWPNAYKNDKTAFSDQLLQNGNIKFYFSGKDQKGYINRLDFKVNGLTAATVDHPNYIDVIKVILPAAVAPAQTVMITTPFHVRLPDNFSRGGHDGDSYQLTQWYPKPAVYDQHGWHEMPYLDQGEFYSEFGNFDVRVTVPANYVVAATGVLQNEDELQWLKQRNHFSFSPVIKKIKLKSGSTRRVHQLYPVSATSMKTLRYLQTNVHDFAWFADKRYVVNYDTCQLAGGKIIDIFTYYTNQQAPDWKYSTGYCKDAARFYSSEVGEYPYQVISAVQGPASSIGGMEYPTITLISPVKSAQDLDVVITHEVGHNWFYGVLGSNERAHPWMDEGINSFYEQKYAAAKYQERYTQAKILFETKAAVNTDQAIETPAAAFSVANYALVAYYKTAAWMRLLETTVGAAAFRKGMQDYYSSWKFKHPQPVDFRNSMEKSTGRQVDTIFNQLSQTGLLSGTEHKGMSIAPVFQIRHFIKLIGTTASNKKELITLGPSLGYNSYDQVMIGAFITNYKLPPSPLRFFIAPMYATGTKSLTGSGTLHYNVYPDNGLFRNMDFFLNGALFHADEYKDSAGKMTWLGVRKIVPGFRLVLNEKNPRSNVYRYLQGKLFYLREEGLKFSKDTVFSGVDTTVSNSYGKTSTNRFVAELNFVVENNRALYPYRADLKASAGKDFLRLTFTGNYFFNYSKGNGSGLNVRVFAGKFIYTGERTQNKQFDTDRYHLNMTGANGYEDYTYSDYFIGRNKFDGFSSQQIMVRDGAFKIRTDLLSTKTGKTDDWLAAANFTSSIFPKIPVKVFADIGTYADAWKNNSGLDHFLFEAGLQLSLFKETINIYVPFIYSRELKYYIQSYLPQKNRRLKTISFSIDLANFNLRKVDRNLVF